MTDTYELDLEPGADDFAEEEMVIDDGITEKIFFYYFYNYNKKYILVKIKKKK